MSRHRLVAACLLFLSAAIPALVVPGPSAARAAEPTTATYTVEATLAVASRQGSSVTGDVGSFGPQLAKATPYTRFDGRGSARTRITGNRPGTVSLPAGHAVQVQVVDASDSKVRFRITHSKDGHTAASTFATTAWGQPHAFQAGHEGTDALVIAVKVTR